MNFGKQIRLLAFLKKPFSKLTGAANSSIQTEEKNTFPKHDAFICYSRKNEEFANELEEFAERYKPPKDLKVPQRYLDFFRDKRDFASGDYFDNRDKHLKNSVKLIVICSPDSRKSKYVNEEIEQFALFSDPDNIIPILFRGIPNNEARPGQEEDMAFPEALYKVMKMPLAINYLGFNIRENKLNKGIYSDSWFSLLASIYDLNRSEVEQREKRRKARIRKITYSILSGSIIILSSLLVLVWISRNEAFNRKLAAEAAQSDALSSQMFAESRRSDAQRETEFERLTQLKEDLESTGYNKITAKDSLTLRQTNLIQEINQTEQEIKNLESNSKEYRSKGKKILLEADTKWSAIQKKKESWVSGRSRPSVPAYFSLEILNMISEGKCMILHYGDVDDPRFILIGGGLFRDYKEILAPRLQQIKDKWSSDHPLPIEKVIASELDVQSIGGLIAMMDSLGHEKSLNKPLTLNIGTLWYNSFQPQPEKWQKARLPISARKLNIKQNVPFDHFIMRPDTAGVIINDGSFKITIINPGPTGIEKLGKVWISQTKRLVDSSFELVIPKENFSSELLKITKAPSFALDSSVFQKYKDMSPVNRSSICLVFELNGKRILFTGDADGNDILKGLYVAGYLSDKNTAHMDIMVLPHSASDLNVSKEFFKRVTADNYIIMGDGTHNNPEVSTLKMLEEAQMESKISMYFINRDGINNHGNKLDQYFLENAKWAKQHRRVFRKSNKLNLMINLLEPVRY